MKKTILLFLLVASFSSIVLAQDEFVISPNPIDSVLCDYDLSDNYDDIILHAKFYNNSGEDMMVDWTATLMNAPGTWEVAICDNNQCYSFGTSDSPEPVFVASGGTSILDVHIRPYGTPGSGTVEMETYPNNQPGNILASAVYNAKVNVPADCAVSTFDLATEKISLYPNPTTGQFFLEDEDQHVQTIEVYNILGKQVTTFDAKAQASFDLNANISGIYMVRLMDKNNQALKTIRLIKK